MQKATIGAYFRKLFLFFILVKLLLNLKEETKERGERGTKVTTSYTLYSNLAMLVNCIFQDLLKRNSNIW